GSRSHASFPTRRSSDLVPICGHERTAERAPARSRGSRGAGYGPLTAGQDVRMAPDVRIKRAYDPPAAEDGYRVLIDRVWPRGVRDRKSTRLNSSHVKIS